MKRGSDHLKINLTKLKRIRFRKKQDNRQIQREIYPVNEKIRSRELRVIDENGQMLGVLPTFKALAIAKERGLDLVEVSPKAEPPVAKFLNYGSFKYQQEKAAKKQKLLQKGGDIKELRLSPRIGKHDLEIRVKQAEKFLRRGDKVDVEILLKGREKQFPGIAVEMINGFIAELKQLISVKVEQEPKRLGNKINATIAPAGDSEPTEELDENN